MSDDENDIVAIAQKLDRFAKVKVLSVQDKGIIEQIEDSGIMVISSKEIHTGDYRKSPFNT